VYCSRSEAFVFRLLTLSHFFFLIAVMNQLGNSEAHQYQKTNCNYPEARRDDHEPNDGENNQSANKEMHGRRPNLSFDQPFLMEDRFNTTSYWLCFFVTPIGKPGSARAWLIPGPGVTAPSSTTISESQCREW
jgi:hypothetical protein